MTNVFRDMHPTTFLRSTPGRNRTVLESIEEIAKQIDEEGRLGGHPRVEIDVRTIFAQSYFDVGEIDRFRNHLEKALVLAKQEYGDSLIVARMHMQLAYAAGVGGGHLHDPTSTLEHANEAIRVYNSLGAFPDDRVYVGKAYSLQVWPERHDEAIAAAREAVRLEAATEGGNAVYTQADLGNIYMLMGDDDSLSQASKCVDAALANYRASENRQAHLEANFLRTRARCHRRRNELQRAVKDYQAAYKLFETQDLRSELEGHWIGLSLADVHFAMGDVNKAFEILDEVEANAREFNVASSLIGSLDLRGWLYFQLCDFETAEPLLEKAKQLAVDEYGVMDDRFALPCSQLALMYEAMGESEQAKEQYRELVPWTQHFVDAPWVDGFAYWLHARGILATHDDVALSADDGAALLDEAEKIANDGLKNTRAWRQPNQEAAFYLVKAMIQQRRNPEKRQEAIDLLNEGLKKVPEPTATIRNARVYQTPTARWQLESKLVEFLVDAERVEDAHDLMIRAAAYRRLNLDRLHPDHIQKILAEVRLGEFRIQHKLHDGDTMDELADAVEKLGQFSPVGDEFCRKWAQWLIETYQDFGNAEKAAKWRSKLDGLQKTDDDFKQASGGTTASHR